MFVVKKKLYSLTFLSFVVLFSLIFNIKAKALPIDFAYNQLSRVSSSSTASHSLYFVLPSGIPIGGNISITYPGSSFSFGSLYDYTDMILEEGNSSNCSTASFTPKTLGASASGTTWGATYSSLVITFTSDTDTITADRCVRVVLNSNGTNHTLTNPTVTSNTVYNINLLTSEDDSAEVAVIILGDASASNVDQINIKLNVAPSILLGVDVVTTDCNNTTQTTPINQAIEFGNLFPGIAKLSGSQYPFICIEAGTNSETGIRILIQSSRNNAVGGLVGAGGGLIASATDDLNSGLVDSGYGVRISSLGTTSLGSFTANSPYNSGVAGNVGILNGLLGSPTAIVTSSGVVRSNSNARIALEVGVKSSITTQQDTYTDTINITAFTNL